jgi:DNA-binding transcriptional LysR family regulator
MLVREERVVGLMRQGHPAAARKLTPEKLRQIPRLAVTLSGGRVVSPIEYSPLARQRLGEVKVSTPHFTSTATALLNSELILIIGELAGATLAELFALRVVQLPVELPAVESCLVWHERTHRDPAQRWFREAIAKSLAPVIARFPPKTVAAATRRRE